MNTIICYKCKNNKPISDFYNQKKKTKCKTCTDLDCEKYRKNNKQQKQKKCIKCLNVKSLIEFYKNANAYYSKYCLECIPQELIERDKAVRERRKNNDRIRKRVFKEKTLLKAAKRRAKQKNIEFNLEINDIVIPKRCPVLDIEIKCGEYETLDSSPSIDRIDNNKGYIKNNIKIISWRANSLKRDATLEELIKITEYMKKYEK